LELAQQFHPPPARSPRSPSRRPSWAPTSAPTARPAAELDALAAPYPGRPLHDLTIELRFLYQTLTELS